MIKIHETFLNPLQKCGKENKVNSLRCEIDSEGRSSVKSVESSNILPLIHFRILCFLGSLRERNTEDIGRVITGATPVDLRSRLFECQMSANVNSCANLCVGASSCWYHIRDKSRKETSCSKKSANGPDKISLYDSGIKGPLKYIGPIKRLASRTGIHPTTKLHLKNLDFHPVCLTRNFRNQNDAPGLRALVPALQNGR
ncbi:hypothetical protein TNCV_3331481 [Trichonephila clavipes]|nr:hypothetical protein TNCV_3331481 [Trichonephila clavipes]